MSTRTKQSLFHLSKSCSSATFNVVNWKPEGKKTFKQHKHEKKSRSYDIHLQHPSPPEINKEMKYHIHAASLTHSSQLKNQLHSL